MEMLRIGSFLTSLLAVCGAASAADLPVKAPPKAQSAAYDPWSGFYVGVNAGGALARNHTYDLTYLMPGNPLSVFGIADFQHAPFGAIFGAQAGWNWHFASAWVGGVEVDWQKSWQSESVCTYACLPASTPPALLSITDQQSLQWLGTARARLGWLAPGGSLLYATGGLAYGRVEQNLSMLGLSFFPTGPTISASYGQTRVGWTAGGGVETPVAGRWSVKAEYLYVDLGTINNTLFSGLDPVAAGFFGFPTQTTTSTSHIHDNVVRVGLNYRLDPPGTAASAPALTARSPRSAAYTWNGLYAGINAGGALARNPTFNPQTFGPVANFPVAGLDSYSHAPLGGLAGAQVGWNWRIRPEWVAGVEADLQWLHQSDSACISECLPVANVPGALPGLLLGLTDAESMTWLGTARGRFGWVSPNNTLWYGTGGLAWGRIKDTLTVSATPPFFAAGAPPDGTFSHDLIGWTIGGGVEVPMWDRWSAKVEYLYVDLGHVSDTLVTPLDPFQLPSTFMTSTSSFWVHDHIVRAGLNYSLN